MPHSLPADTDAVMTEDSVKKKKKHKGKNKKGKGKGASTLNISLDPTISGVAHDAPQTPKPGKVTCFDQRSSPFAGGAYPPRRRTPITPGREITQSDMYLQQQGYKHRESDDDAY